MRKTLTAAVLAATVLLTTGCAAELLAGAAIGQAAAGNIESSGTVKAAEAATERLEAVPYTRRITPEQPTLMAGYEWGITGGGWRAGATVMVSLTGGGGVIGGPAPVTADQDGRITTRISIPEGTPTGRYTLTAADPADPSGPQSTDVSVLDG